jgi:hypothetical protein
MRTLQALVVGWADTNIRTIAEAGLLSQFGSVLITSIDSTTDLSGSAMRSRIAEFDPTCTSLGVGIVVHGESMARLAAGMNLGGFDELWCFERFPSTPKPNDLWIVSPFNIETDPVLPQFVSWMTETNCKLSLGDGIGLNYGTPREELASNIEHLAGFIHERTPI